MRDLYASWIMLEMNVTLGLTNIMIRKDRMKPWLVVSRCANRIIGDLALPAE